MYKSLLDLTKNLLRKEIDLINLPFEPLPKHPIANQTRMILPAFLGEMGLEVRGFLGMIEPWLNSGWIIPAKRPSLYPHGSAFFDSVFFDRINEIKNHFGIQEMVGQLFLNGTINFSNFGYTIINDMVTLTSKTEEFDSLRKIILAEHAIRLAFVQRFQTESTIPSHFHQPLTSVTFSGWTSPLDLNWTAFSAITPTYKPISFENPVFTTQSHIGVQLRNLPNNPNRNSNVNNMLCAAECASKLTGYPILVYGAQQDIFPAGYQFSKDLVPDLKTQLDGELSLLKFCKLMIAPDSGWADLMSWLRIPTLLEQQFFPWGFEGLRPFKPKLLTMKNPEDISTIQRLLSAQIDEVLLPEPMEAIQNNSHLMPNSPLIQNFWDDFSR